MKALKGNKVYTIDEKQKKTYVDAGFDIQDDDGKVIAYGRGKTVPYAEHAALREEKEALEKKVAELETLLEKLAGTTSDDAVEPEKKAGRKA